MPKASVAVAIIAKNSERTLAACLDSIVPFVEECVVCVDANTTDRTAELAREHGATVYEGLQVCEPHECPAHGKIMAQHFAKARQASFEKLRKDVDFWLWLDADDVFQGGEKLADYLSKIPPEVAGVWLPYHYSQAGKGGPTATLFDRERFVRTSLPWAWQYRVHEILAPVGCTTESMVWTRTDEISVVHQGEGHDTAGSARRNITLLEIDLEENAEDMRAWFYLGNQYFALNDFGPAAECYERATKTDNAYQLWQTYIYLSMAYEKIGDLERSRMMAFKALDIQPTHPEPYYRLAANYMLLGDKERTVFWTAEGDRRPDAPAFVFKNPLDRPFNARLVLAQAFANAGETSKARRELERAAQAIPTKEVIEGIQFHKQIEEDTKTADAWVRILTTMLVNPCTVGSTRSFGKDDIPPDAWRFGRVRDIVVPHMLKARPNTQPRLIFWCGHSVEPWAPPSLNTTGIGGSETAVIQIAKRFARDGWRVDVYNDCDRFEGVYDDVGYWDDRRLGQGERCEVLVSWRNPAAHALPVERRMSALWCHDLNSGPDPEGHYQKWDRVLGVSQWHADYLQAVYGGNVFAFVPNGIDLDRFSQPVKKVPFRCVYASSPDRGLEQLLAMWPRIVEQEPAAELHIGYGWETIDKYIALGHQQLHGFKQHILQLLERTPNVVWRGRLPQDELAKLYGESVIWAYPASFLEVSCISAMEAMAGGAVPVTSAAGALPETVGDGGLLVTGNVYTRSWRDFFVHCLRGVTASPEVRLPLEAKARERAKAFSWDRSYEEYWKPLVAVTVEKEKVKVCKNCRNWATDAKGSIPGKVGMCLVVWQEESIEEYRQGDEECRWPYGAYREKEKVMA